MYEDELKTLSEKMDKSITALKNEFTSIRTGQANASLLDRVFVEYYGSRTPVTQVATVSVPEARMLVVQPWDKTLLKEIEKAILQSDLGLVPMNDGNLIRMAIPQLTEERRKELVKVVNKKSEEAKVAVRNIRRDGNVLLKKEEKTADIPIIFLTAKDTENDMLTGFNLGADDNISKPFSIRQVVARVKAVLRRTSDKEKVPENECLKYETLSLDTKRIKASVDGQEVPLTKKEFEILKLLLENKGNVFSREEILSRIWKDEVYVLDRTIDVNITRLRKKIGPYGKNIVTRLGFGYCFEN